MNFSLAGAARRMLLAVVIAMGIQHGTVYAQDGLDDIAIDFDALGEGGGDQKPAAEGGGAGADLGGGVDLGIGAGGAVDGGDLLAPAAGGGEVDAGAQPDPEAGPTLTPEQIAADEEVRRRERELQAEQLFVEGRESYIEANYEDATSKFIAADVKLQEVSRTDPEVAAKRELISRLLAIAYLEWADKVAKEAEQFRRVEEYDDAIDKYQKVIELDPSRRATVQARVRALQKEKKKAEFARAVSPAVVDSEKLERDLEIDKKVARGKVFFDNKRYGDAREEFEQVLLKDPYNITATRLLRRINDMYAVHADERREVMRSERLAEIAWKWSDPVTPLVSPTGPGDGTDEVAKIVRENEGIQEKLENIIIPKISFEDASIKAVVKYLKQRSKDLDPDQIGVNIFLQLDPAVGADGGGAPAGGGAAPPDDPFAAGGGDDPFAAGGLGGGDPFAAPAGGGDDPFAAPAGGGAEDPFAAPAGGGADPFAAPGGGGADPFAAGGGGAAAAAPPSNDIPITMDFDNIPLGEAIRYICNGAGLKYRIEEHAVIIAHPDRALDPMETRIYPVDAGFLDAARSRESTEATFGGDEVGEGGGIGESTATDPVTFFGNFGVDFPDGAKISYNTRTSKLIVTNTPENLRKVERLLKELNIQPTQVTIETKFVEIAENDLDELGFQWTFVGKGDDFDQGTTDLDTNLSGDLGFRIFKQVGSGVVESLSSGVRGADAMAFTSATPLLKVNSIISDAQFSTVVRALSQRAGTDVLSAPKVTTLSGNTAVIKMVQERYFPDDWSEPELTGSTVSGNGNQTGASFTPSIPEFGSAREIGVIMEVTPTVAADGYSIDLELNPEVLEFVGFDDYSYEITIDGNSFPAVLQMPIIAKRSLATRVIVWDGETVVLGGMVIERVADLEDGVPYLQDLPLLGRFFQSKATDKEKRNLLIFVSARLVNPAGLPIRTQDIRGLPDFRR
jgi:Flp pilus assembly secretin CpaC/tetratricopeptide (TPR) repeat protein